jgi:hypothetical protein
MKTKDQFFYVWMVLALIASVVVSNFYFLYPDHFNNIVSRVNRLEVQMKNCKCEGENNK